MLKHKNSKEVILKLPIIDLNDNNTSIQYPIEIEVKTDLNDKTFSICMTKNQFNRYILTLIDCEEIGLKSSVKNTLFNNLLDINFSLKTPNIYHSIDITNDIETYKVNVTVLKDRKAEFKSKLITIYKFYIPKN